MRSRVVYAVARWILALSAVVMAYFYFSYAVFSAWQTGAPSGWERPELWAYEAYRSFGRSVALVACAILVALNVRPGWPWLRSKWNLLLIGVVLGGILIPPAMQFLSIDSCLDAGGMWDYQAERCESPA